MTTLSEWKKLSSDEQKEYLSDPEKFTSYADKDYKLAEDVALDLREQLEVEISEITIGNKGGYLILLVEVPHEKKGPILSTKIDRYLGFQVIYCNT